MALGTAASGQHAQPEIVRGATSRQATEREADLTLPPAVIYRHNLKHQTMKMTKMEIIRIRIPIFQPAKVPLCVHGFEDMDFQQDTFLIARNDDAQ
ncbi:hypothetical protein RvY_15885 [Ramazzottius varieornatus]|uniref:Uncharacterized protein n=1 Tax=Ramazzottius varieornatus TaxID=947166 RepID=A0A1D1VWH2_RAMVA|nr:hypothetical protein RvY_15885 [Ramazzottius varieornatus]